MLTNKTPSVPKFLNENAEESDKINWKYVYATYLLTIGLSPQEAKTKKINLSALLPILAEREQRWYAVEPEMMKTSHKLIQRMNIFLNRYKDKVMEVSVLMQEIRESKDPSAEIDQTFNRSKTDSEKSDDEQY